MTSDDHTPGPWSYNPESPNRVTSSTGETVAATYGGMVGDKQQVANALLIASAPTMLDYVKGRAGDGDQRAREILDGMEPGAEPK